MCPGLTANDREIPLFYARLMPVLCLNQDSKKNVSCRVTYDSKCFAALL